MIFIKCGIFVENSLLFKKYTQKVLSYLTFITSTDSKKAHGFSNHVA